MAYKFYVQRKSFFPQPGSGALRPLVNSGVLGCEEGRKKKKRKEKEGKDQTKRQREPRKDGNGAARTRRRSSPRRSRGSARASSASARTSSTRPGGRELQRDDKTILAAFAYFQLGFYVILTCFCCIAVCRHRGRNAAARGRGWTARPASSSSSSESARGARAFPPAHSRLPDLWGSEAYLLTLRYVKMLLVRYYC